MLTQFITILIAQQLISTWFLFDFFITRDSLAARNLWNRRGVDNNESISQVLSLAKTVEQKKCLNSSNNYEATFDKLVFIVIDAFGSEFIPMIDNERLQDYSSDTIDTMPFVMRSIKQQTAMGFVAKAATPTVTMPRIKALLSGTIPSFVDIVYNLASDVRNFDDDNIVRIAKSQNKTLVFYGDDTWLSLFKRSDFARAEETFSFFAHDYTNVDTNVTEKALPETSADTIDWDFLMLHYLGLDHIGHVFGTNDNPLITKKLGEMDRVINQIHDNMVKKSLKTLVVICGDHGMSKEGNHGGGSDLESNTAVLFLPIGQDLGKLQEKPQIFQPHIKQVDLATTLSLVLGLSIPTMSKGVAIKPFLDRLWPREADESKLACALLSNMIQLASLLESNEFDTLYQEDILVHNLRDHLSSKDNLRSIARSYHSISVKAQKVLLDTIASRSYPFLTLSLLIFVTVLTIISMKRTSLRLLLPTISKMEKLICLAVILLPIIMLGSTDFIEYEQKFWPVFSVVSFVLLCCAQKNIAKLIPTIDPIRGILFIVTALVTSLRLFTSGYISDSSYTLSILSIIMLCNFLRQNSDVKKHKGLLALLIGFTIMFTKHVEESHATVDQHDDLAYRAIVQRLTTLVVIIYSTIEIVATRNSLTLRETEGIGQVALVIRKLASGWICVAFLLARLRDFTFIIANVMMETSLNSVCKSIQVPLVVRAIIYYNFAQAAFFNQGNSNSFSSIDVKPAFFCQTSYSLYLSISLVALATYSTQIYWLMKLFQRIQDDKTTLMSQPDKQHQRRRLGPTFTTTDSAETSVKLIRDLIIARNFLGQSFYMFVCMWLRNHLFIWSVLSPKLIFQFVTSSIILMVVITISSLSNLMREIKN